MQAAVQLMAMLSWPQSLNATALPSKGNSTSSLPSIDCIGDPRTQSSLRFLDGLDSIESLHIAATHLNAHTLSTFEAVEITWTHNISRHMLLCKRGGRHILELFALPSAFDATILTSDVVSITSEYTQEITESYSILFNAQLERPQHAILGKVFGLGRFCWCWSCSSLRFRDKAIFEHQKHSEVKGSRAKCCHTVYASEFDPRIVELMGNEPSDWTPELFPSLWSRIVVLEDHLHSAKPWNIWILFRDKRDTLQFWTFL